MLQLQQHLHYNALLNSQFLKRIKSIEKISFKTQEVDSIELAHDEINIRKNSQLGTTKRLYKLLSQANDTIVIDSPYLILSNRLKGIFIELLNRGVKIRILTNSLKATDGLFPQAGYLRQRKMIAQMGIELYEYYSHDSFHAKSFVIDGEIAIIGSFNLDPRSENLNTETIAIVHDENIASLLKASMDNKLETSYKIDVNGRPLHMGEKLPGVSLMKKIKARMIQYLVAPLIKGLL